MKVKTMIVIMLIGAVCSIMFSTQCEAAVKIGYGWSVNPEETKAVAEAVDMLQKTVESPKLVFILNESSYDDAIVIKTLRKSLKDTRIFGYEVSFAVFTQDGIHRGEKGSLALMGFDADNWVIGVGGIGMGSSTTVSDIKKSATLAVEQAIQDAGKTKADEPSVVMIAPTKLKEEPIIDAIEEIFGKEVKLMGGTPGGPMVFANDTVIEKGFSIAVIYAESKIGVGYHSGVQTGIRMRKQTSGKVTAIGENNRILKEIDGRPAFDVYNEWSGGTFDYVDIENLSEPLPIWETAGRTPLVKLYDLGEGKKGTNVTIPGKITPDRSIIVGTDLYVGDTLYYALGTKKTFIKRAGTIVRQALVDGRIKKNELAGAIHAYCRGAAFGQLGKEVIKLQPVVDATKKEMDGKPFIGGFTAGEQGNIRGHGSFHGNLSSSMVVFSE